MYMKKTLLFSFLVTLCFGNLFGQRRTMTFTSVTDAKFFVYLNGRLQNERSTGMITLNNLEDKEYHVRIVIDDPFEVATTRKIRPDENGCEYTVRFNAVRERVDLKKSDRRHGRSEESGWTPETTNAETATTPDSDRPRRHQSIRRNENPDTATERIVNTLKIKIDK